MTLIDNIYLLAVMAPTGFSLVSGWNEGRWLGLFLGLIAGLVLSFACVCGVRVLSKLIGHHPELTKANPTPFWVGVSWLLCVVLAGWILIISVAGSWLTKLSVQNLPA